MQRWQRKQRKEKDADVEGQAKTTPKADEKRKKSVVQPDDEADYGTLRKRIHSRAWAASRAESKRMGLNDIVKTKRASRAAAQTLREYFGE